MDEFLNRLAETLAEAPGSLHPDTVLDDVTEWDSLGTLTTVAMIREVYGVRLLSEELKSVKTAGDLWRAVEARWDKQRPGST